MNLRYRVYSCGTVNIPVAIIPSINRLPLATCSRSLNRPIMLSPITTVTVA